MALPYLLSLLLLLSQEHLFAGAQVEEGPGSPATCLAFQDCFVQVDCELARVRLFSDSHCRTKIDERSFTLFSKEHSIEEQPWVMIGKQQCTHPRVRSPPTIASLRTMWQAGTIRSRAAVSRSQHQFNDVEREDQALTRMARGLNENSANVPPGCSLQPQAWNTDDDSPSTDTGFVSLHCSNSQLTAVPSTNVPPYVVTLHLGHNAISSLSPDALQIFPNLGFLFLPHNQITSLPANFFQYTVYIGIINLQFNAITSLSSTLFSPLGSLLELNISNNRISELPATLFAPLVSIVKLDLSHNTLGSLAQNQFVTNTLLTTLSLRNNQISFLPVGIFDTLTALSLLDLSWNRLYGIPPNIFTTLRNITNLYLSNNGLANLTPQQFSSNTQLTQLFLAGGVFNDFPETIFWGLSQLQMLFLQQCQILQLSPLLFSNLTSLQALYLYENPVTLLPPGIFSALSKVTLLDLANMGYIQLSPMTYPANLFSTMTSLQTLFLVNTNFGQFPLSLFSNNTTLQAIDFGQSSLAAIPETLFAPLVQLQHLDLRYNSLTSLAPNTFATNSQLQWLSLTHNALTSLPLGILYSTSVIDTLDLSINAFTSIGPFFFTDIMHTTVIAFVQGTCLGSVCPQYLPASLSVLINMGQNPLQSISKTAFDVLPAHFSIQLQTNATMLNINSSYCCGITWLTRTPSAILPPTLLCGGVPFFQIENLPQCMCKQNASFANPYACVSLTNITATAQGCSPSGCPVGQRPYTASTVPAVSCSFVFEENANNVELYNTACQECAVPGCADCLLSLSRCTKCLPGLFLYVSPSSGVSQCVSNCSAIGALYNAWNSLCAYCSVGCTSCQAEGTSSVCLACQPGYGLFATTCVECTAAIAAGLNLAQCVIPRAEASSVPVAKIVAPVLIVTAVLLALGVYGWRRLRGRNMHLSERLLNTEKEMADTHNELSAIRKVWEIDLAEVERETIVGHGAMGEVWKGHWRGIPVAVKMLTGVYLPLDELRDEMDREATMLQTLRHAHVVQFLGAGTSEGRPFIVTELMPLGALNGLLLGRCPGHTLARKDWATKRRFVFEIAAGMALVHSLGRMHRDLKSGNILAHICHGIIRLKVADFGTVTLAGMGQELQAPRLEPEPHYSMVEHAEAESREVSRTRTHLTKGIGTPLWMAPEIMAGKKYGPAADVYSFAIVLWEIASQSEPWPDVQGAFIVSQLLQRLEAGERLPLGSDWPSDITTCMQQCWLFDPTQRPSFAAITTTFKAAGVTDANHQLPLPR
eukprot:m.209283 g.209283  ORF g.209283 m.209283 type:complete len:1267 (+) comp15552_c1_seq11:120-3920(+)